MDVDGTWRVEIETPDGTQTGVVRLHIGGGGVTGAFTDDLGSAEVVGGHVRGDQVQWTQVLYVPFEVRQTFTMTVSGDTMTGEVVAGPFPPVPATAHRA